MLWLWIFFWAAHARAAPDASGCSTEDVDAAEWRARSMRAWLVPRLSLGVRGAELTGGGLAERSVEVFASLRWPLERRLPSGLGGLSSRRRQRAEDAAARARTSAQVRARRADGSREQLDRQLDEEEARAELAALGCP